ncbi:MAG: pyridoxamine 5-phosphate oxidase [Rhodobacterales bacterium]|nr:pyridoxamine 5-phosphate oxidase [Rhodobacterales bacterium]
MTNLIRPTDDDARQLARNLLINARHGALGVIDPETGGPVVTRVAIGWDGTAALLLVSSLSGHTTAIRASPATSLLVGQPSLWGDPLTHPRRTLLPTAEKTDEAAHRARWQADHPKSGLYFDFADFLMFSHVVCVAPLNGGFGNAFRLGPQDLTHGLTTSPRSPANP